jgi:hypothetical protein
VLFGATNQLSLSSSAKWLYDVKGSESWCYTHDGYLRDSYTNFRQYSQAAPVIGDEIVATFDLREGADTLSFSQNGKNLGQAFNSLTKGGKNNIYLAFSLFDAGTLIIINNYQVDGVS